MSAEKEGTSPTESLPKPVFYSQQLVCGKWQILEELGRGGCGVVVSVKNVEDEQKGKEPLMAAMKAETIDPKGNISQTVKVEVSIL